MFQTGSLPVDTRPLVLYIEQKRRPVCPGLDGLEEERDMDDRENLTGIFRRTGYERMPAEYSVTPAVQAKLRDYVRRTGYRLPEPAWQSIPGCRQTNPKPEGFYRQYYDFPLAEGTSIDCFGVAHEPGSPQAMHMTRMRCPMERMTTLRELKAYEYPRFSERVTLLQKKMVLAARSQKKFAMGNMQCTVWEKAWNMRGMEVLMTDMALNEELADYHLDRVTQISVAQARNFALAGVDGLYLGDDIGMQRALMFSLEMYRRFLKPRLKQVIDAAKNIRPDIIVIYHSCGYAKPFIEDLIEVGVDVLNPVQPECMSFEELFTAYGDRLSFFGTLGTQTLMPFGTPEQVRETVNRNLDFAGPRGGLLVSPTHILEPEVPVENIVAFIDACRDYRPA